MIEFSAIERAAIQRLGDAQTLEDRLLNAEPPETLAMIGDDRYLSVMSRRIFRAGLTHQLVDKRWPAFELAFGDFALDYVASLEDSDLFQLTKDERLIRHRRKLFALRDNARSMQEIVDQHGSFGVWLAGWPEDEIVDLWIELRRRFSQLGGNSAPAFLRMCGKDTFVLTDWVVRGLEQWGAYTGKTTTHVGLRAIQEVFNRWESQSGRDFCQISQIVAFSIG